ncbi:hypothetical protein [Saccharothrix xinjiangensis]|uniref:Uncharacterized protein n=1 Tax=Saccharothrix xinjiangensis TaxID=204798 RepID=A0ABV9XWF5_9PSEU
MFERLTVIVAATAFAAATAFGTAGTASATTIPDVSCINSDPLGVLNRLVCALKVTEQEPIALPDCVLTIGDILNSTKVLNGAELDLVEVTIEDVVLNLGVEDDLVFKQALADALNDLGIFYTDISMITLDCY